MPGRQRRGSSGSEVGLGGKGIGVAIAGMLMLAFAAMPFLLLVMLYLFLSGYAIAHGIASGQGEDAETIVVGFVVTTSLFALLIAVAVHLIGRSITPRKRRDAGG
jgi:hypothetical protein